MRRRFRQVVAAVLMVAAGGSLMFTSNLGCESFVGQSLMNTLDFCFIFDCDDGLLGGTIKPCQQALDVNGDPTGPVLVDCPTDEE